MTKVTKDGRQVKVQKMWNASKHAKSASGKMKQVRLNVW